MQIWKVLIGVCLLAATISAKSNQKKPKSGDSNNLKQEKVDPSEVDLSKPAGEPIDEQDASESKTHHAKNNHKHESFKKKVRELRKKYKDTDEFKAEVKKLVEARDAEFMKHVAEVAETDPGKADKMKAEHEERKHEREEIKKKIKALKEEIKDPDELKVLIKQLFEDEFQKKVAKVAETDPEKAEKMKLKHSKKKADREAKKGHGKHKSKKSKKSKK